MKTLWNLGTTRGCLLLSGLVVAALGCDSNGGGIADFKPTGGTGGAGGAGGAAGSVGMEGNPATGNGGAGGGTAGSGGGSVGSGGGGGSETGGMGGSMSPDAGVPDAGGMTGDASMTDPGDEPQGVDLVEGCEGGSTEPCGSFVTNDGTEVDLGPYGAVMEPNVGTGFETEVASGDSDGGLACSVFASLFGQDADSTGSLLDIEGLDMALYTVYRPANWVEGETYPIITWGNGTCAQPEGYGALLRYVASHGYFVVAANSRWVGGNGAMTVALDFAFAANEDPESPYYQKLDTDKVGAMGHSQGAGATATAADDSRVDNVILFNGVGGGAPSKPFLTISGDRDIGSPTAQDLADTVNGAPKAAYIFYHMIPMTGSSDGHLTLMTQPQRVVEPTVGWFDFMLKGEADARDLFIGDDCGLCGMDAQFEYGQNGLD